MVVPTKNSLCVSLHYHFFPFQAYVGFFYFILGEGRWKNPNVPGCFLVTAEEHGCELILRCWLSPDLSAWQAEETKRKEAQAKVGALVSDIIKFSQEAANNGLIDKEKYIIPPHLHDLQEADLPETQRGLVISEIAQFRERAAKREREKMRDVRDNIPTLLNTPSGPKQREWGKPQNTPSAPGTKHQGFGKGPQGYNKAPGFVKREDSPGGKEPLKDDKMAGTKTDEELEAEKKEQRRQEEELSFKDVRHFLSLFFTI